jgi:hypothetical protein
LAFWLGLILTNLGGPPALAAEADSRACPKPKFQQNPKSAVGQRRTGLYADCEKLVADYQQLGKEWKLAFDSAQGDLRKARESNDADASWLALKRIYLNMNLREPDLNKLIHRAAVLKKRSADESKFEKIPDMEMDKTPENAAIIDAVQEATDAVNASGKGRAEDIGKLTPFFQSLEGDMKARKAEWVEKVSNPASAR